MAEHIRITPQGEAIIPKDVCEKLDWLPGTEMEIRTGGGEVIVGLREEPREWISLEEFRRRVPPHDGPPVTLEQMEEAIDRALVERWKAKEARSR